MDLTFLKSQSITELIKENAGNAGVNFYAELFEEDLNEFIELSDELKKMTNNKFDFDFIDIKDKTLTLKTDSGLKFLEFTNKRDLGLRGDSHEKQLQYFKVVNDSLKDRNLNERFFIYYDQLEPDTHWVGFMDNKLIYELRDFIKGADPDTSEMKEYIHEDVRVLGIGIADENCNEYSEIVILP
jgi:hypothetical protein